MPIVRANPNPACTVLPPVIALGVHFPRRAISGDSDASVSVWYVLSIVVPGGFFLPIHFYPVCAWSPFEPCGLVGRTAPTRPLARDWAICRGIAAAMTIRRFLTIVCRNHSKSRHCAVKLVYPYSFVNTLRHRFSVLPHLGTCTPLRYFCLMIPPVPGFIGLQCDRSNGNLPCSDPIF